MTLNGKRVEEREWSSKEHSRWKKGKQHWKAADLRKRQSHPPPPLLANSNQGIWELAQSKTGFLGGSFTCHPHRYLIHVFRKGRDRSAVATLITSRSVWPPGQLWPSEEVTFTTVPPRETPSSWSPLSSNIDDHRHDPALPSTFDIYEVKSPPGSCSHKQRWTGSFCESLRKLSGQGPHSVEFLYLLRCNVSLKDLERSREEPSDLIVFRWLKWGLRVSSFSRSR